MMKGSVRSRGRSPGQVKPPRIPPPPQFKPPPLPDEDDDVFIRPITRTRSPLPPSDCSLLSGSLSPIGEVDTPESSRSVSPNPIIAEMWKSQSPQPFVVSHDTFIKGGGRGTAAEKTLHPNDGSKVLSGVAEEPMFVVEPKAERKIPTMSLQPPTPTDIGKRNLDKISRAAERPRNDAGKVKQVGEDSVGEPRSKVVKVDAPLVDIGVAEKQISISKSSASSSRDQEKPDNVHDEHRSKVVKVDGSGVAMEVGDKGDITMEEKLPKMKRRVSKKIQPRRELQTSPERKLSKTEQTSQTSTELPAEVTMSIHMEDLSEKEKCVINEVLQARQDRSRSNSRISTEAPAIEKEDLGNGKGRKSNEKQNKSKMVQDAKESRGDIQETTEGESVKSDFGKSLASNPLGNDGHFAETADGDKKTDRSDKIESLNAKNSSVSSEAQQVPENNHELLAGLSGESASVAENVVETSEIPATKENTFTLESTENHTKPSVISQISIEEILPIPLDNDENIADLSLEKIKEHLLKEESKNVQLRENLSHLQEKMNVDRNGTRDEINMANKENVKLPDENKIATEEFNAPEKETLMEVDEVKPISHFSSNVSQNVTSSCTEYESSSTSLHEHNSRFRNDRNVEELHPNKDITPATKADTLTMEQKTPGINVTNGDSSQTKNAEKMIAIKKSELVGDTPVRSARRARDNKPDVNVAGKTDTLDVKACVAQEPPVTREIQPKPQLKTVSREQSKRDAKQTNKTDKGRVDGRKTDDRKLDKPEKNRERQREQSTGGSSVFELTPLCSSVYLGGSECLCDAGQLKSAGIRVAVVVGSSAGESPPGIHLIQVSSTADVSELRRVAGEAGGGRGSLVVLGADSERLGGALAALAAAILSRRENIKLSEAVQILERTKPNIILDKDTLARLDICESGLPRRVATYLPVLVFVSIIYFAYMSFLKYLESQHKRDEGDEYSYFHILRWP